MVDKQVPGSVDVYRKCGKWAQCFTTPTIPDISKTIGIIDISLAFGISVAELVLTALPNFYVQIYNEYNMRGEIVVEQYAHQTSIFLTVVIICMFLLILEGWLLETVLKGTAEKDLKKLKNWMSIRLAFLAINTVMTLYRILELQFCLYDLIYIPVAMYRVLEIVLVKGIVAELMATSQNIAV